MKTVFIAAAIFLFLSSVDVGAEPASCGGCPPLVTYQIIGICKPIVTPCNDRNTITVRCEGSGNCPVHWQSPKGISTIIGPSADIVCNPASGHYYFENTNNHVSSVMCR